MTKKSIADPLITDMIAIRRIAEETLETVQEIRSRLEGLDRRIDLIAAHLAGRE
jgi:hypothetical protein